MTTPATPATPATPTPDPAEANENKTLEKVETFFEHIGHWLKAHLGTAASFEKTAATALSVAAPLLQELLTLIKGEPFAAKVGGVVTQVQNDLNDTAALLNGAGASGGITVQSALGAVQSNLGTLLADADIKNSAKSSQIQGIVNTLLGEVTAVLGAIPAKA